MRPARNALLCTLLLACLNGLGGKGTPRRLLQAGNPLLPSGPAEQQQGQSLGSLLDESGGAGVPASEAASAANPVYAAEAQRSEGSGYGTAVGLAGPGGAPAVYTPALEQEGSKTTGSPYGAADAGSASASDVLAAMLAGAPDTFADATAAAGPIASSVALERAITSGSGLQLVSIVGEAQNSSNAAAATDAFQGGLWRAICSDPTPSGDTLAAASASGGVVARTAAAGVDQASSQCCDATLAAMTRASTQPGFNESFPPAAAAASTALAACAIPPALAQAFESTDASATATRAPGEVPGAGPASQSVAAAGVPGATPVADAVAGGVAPVPEPSPLASNRSNYGG